MGKLENGKMGQELTNENLRFGLNQKQLQLITETIVSFPEIEKVFIFGSRAIDTNRPCSDIDLALSGQQLTRTICNRFSSALMIFLYHFCLMWSITIRSKTTISKQVLTRKEKYFLNEN